MRHLWVVSVVLAILLVGAAVGARNAEATSYDPEELRLLQLLNDYRKDHGLAPVILSDTLSVASERHSEDMGKHGFFAHITVESSYYRVGSAPWDRMKAEGYDYNTDRGENIAVGYESAEEAFAAWRRSPSHNAAMLDGKYRVIGIGRVNVPGSGYAWYWTTDFGAEVDPSAHAPGEQPEGQEPADKAPPAPAVPDLGGIENGAMNNGSVWKQQAKDGGQLITGGHARLGGYHGGRDKLSQKVLVPRDGELSFDLRITTNEPHHPSDRLLVRLADEDWKPLTVLRRYSDGDETGWTRETLDLSRYAGRTVYLNFYVETDPRHITTFYLDSVALKAKSPS